MQPRRDPEPRPPKEPDLTPRQRWVAAQRLAAGDRPRLVAAMVGARLASLRLLLADDPEFAGLVEDCREVHALPRDEWRARAELFARDAAERAMVDGRVSTLNLVLKATDLLDRPALGTGDDEEDGPDPAQDVIDALSDEQWAEYRALGESGRDDEGEDEDAGAAATGVSVPTEPVPVRPALRVVDAPAELATLIPTDAAAAWTAADFAASSSATSAARPSMADGAQDRAGPRTGDLQPVAPAAARPNATGHAPADALSPRPHLRLAREPVPAWHRFPGGWPGAP